MSRSLGARHVVTKGKGPVGQEILQIIEVEPPTWSIRAQKILLDSLCVPADLHRVNSLRKVKVVVNLIRIPTEFKRRRHDGASRKSRVRRGYLQRAYAGSRIKTKLRIGG